MRLPLGARKSGANKMFGIFPFSLDSKRCMTPLLMKIPSPGRRVIRCWPIRQSAQPEDTVKRLALALQQNDIIPFSYLMEEDTLIVYNASMEVVQKVPEYLSYLKEDTQIHPEDRWKAIEFYEGRMRGPIEVRTIEADGRISRKLLSATRWKDPAFGKIVLAGSAKDVTAQKDRESVLEVQAKRDSLTMLYNHTTGKELINEYLNYKNPYASCGMMSTYIPLLVLTPHA